MSRTPSSAASTRPKRTPISGRNVLTVKGKEEGYEYRIVNDSGDRIEMFKDAGWELVDGKDVTVGDRRVDRAGAEGSKAQVSVGGGTKAFVMRIPKELYDEDQKAKNERVNALEETMKKQALSAGDYGKIETKVGSA
jgi:hypothetical protein